MNDASPAADPPATARRPRVAAWIWAGVLLAWFIALCVVPDPRPLGAPEWTVDRVRSLAAVSEPTARALATFVFRAAGVALLGLLVALSLRRARLRWAAPVALVAAPTLALAAKWINFGYFPVDTQLQLAAAFAIVGTLAGLALRRSRIAIAALLVVTVGLAAWGTPRRIPDDLYDAARVTGLHVLEHADDAPAGDDGFAAIFEIAFAYAEDNSHGTDPVLANRAAILALGVILGDDRVARVGRRPVDLHASETILALRRRVRLGGRGDLSQHFWVSAALVVVLDERQALAIGATKELKDSLPGGSGFSFVDMAANKAGIAFAVAATRDEASARDVQLRIADRVVTTDYLPEVSDLPEGIARDDFQTEFGGLGGAETRRLLAEIDRRLASLPGLR